MIHNPFPMIMEVFAADRAVVMRLSVPRSSRVLPHASQSWRVRFPVKRIACGGLAGMASWEYA